jgi:hypothetical protein
MKAKTRFLLLIVIALIAPGCSTESTKNSVPAKPMTSAIDANIAAKVTPPAIDANIAAKITPSAIDDRIAEIRMGDIIVKTKRGSDVKVRQVRHEFFFGAAIPDSLAEKSADAMSADDRKMFLKVLSENFNYAVHENALKWYDCEAEPNVVDYYRADRIW